jgi:hypothetical protein
MAPPDQGPVDGVKFSVAQFPGDAEFANEVCQCWSAHHRRVPLFLSLVNTKSAIRIDCAEMDEYMSLEEMANPRVLMTLDIAGKPLPDRPGPARLLDPSKYGYKSAKLITSITFVAEGRVRGV